ncbi:MAG: DUF1289 domain-containing protein [Tepidimonas sp.]|nr:DUF1289 domain-containing protein [Tepidimonas sp.]
MTTHTPAPRRLSLAEALQRHPAGAPVPSPCIGVCRIEAASGLCAGCWRTLDEIAAWSSSDDATRRLIWQAIEARQASAATRGDSPAGTLARQTPEGMM